MDTQGCDSIHSPKVNKQEPSVSIYLISINMPDISALRTVVVWGVYKASPYEIMMLSTNENITNY